ncbi:hypothetical protein [Enemella sp. A6]|uniref:hypothetical protein n=1 Tax=Enemella sp. A6 TaxID=3440152 RepID=UPI003EB78308
MTITQPQPKTTTAQHDDKNLIAPLVGTGALMAVYLVTRPYGDAAGGDTLAAAEAFASTRWVIAHVSGMLAIASFGRLALRLHDNLGLFSTRLARTATLAGAVLVLPYYGLETFGLQAAGRAALAGDTSVLNLVGEMRDHPAAMTMFGVGLLALALGGVGMALGWQRARGNWAAWPLAAVMAGVLPQFFLPPTGRITYGVACAAAAGVWLVRGLMKRRNAAGGQ